MKEKVQFANALKQSFREVDSWQDWQRSLDPHASADQKKENTSPHTEKAKQPREAVRR